MSLRSIGVAIGALAYTAGADHVDVRAGDIGAFVLETRCAGTTTDRDEVVFADAGAEARVADGVRVVAGDTVARIDS